MTISRKRAGLILLVALSTWARSDHLLGQERPSPIGAVVAFVEEDVRTTVPREMRPYDIGRMFLRVGPGVSGRGALGRLDQQNLERLGVALVEVDRSEMLLAGEGGQYVRDDGVYVVINSVDREKDGRVDQPEAALAIKFSYYVTFRWPGKGPPMICFHEWRIVVRPTGAGEEGWEVVEARRLGIC